MSHYYLEHIINENNRMGYNTPCWKQIVNSIHSMLTLSIEYINSSSRYVGCFYIHCSCFNSHVINVNVNSISAWDHLELIFIMPCLYIEVRALWMNCTFSKMNWLSGLWWRWPRSETFCLFSLCQPRNFGILCYYIQCKQCKSK